MSNTRKIPAAGFLVSFCLLLLMLAGADRAAAAASPFKIDFDTSELQVSVIDNLPLETLGTKASLEGTVDENGAVKIPAGGFKLPEVGITEPVAIKGFMGIEGPMTGTFDAQTGQLVLDGEAGIWVSVNIQQLLTLVEGFGLDIGGSLGSVGPLLGLLGNDLTCGFSPMDIQFSTEANSQAAGQRFTKGTLGPGALSAEWAQLGPFAGRTKILGFLDACVLIKDALPGLLSGLGGGTEIGGFDIGALLGGIDLTQLDNLNLGPSAITLSRTTDESVIIEPPIEEPAAAARLKLSVTPKKRRARAGKAASFRAVVRNVGGTSARGVRVCATAPKKAARKARVCRSLGSIAPGATDRGKFRLKLKKSAARRSYRISFRVVSGSRAKPGTSARLRVK